MEIVNIILIWFVITIIVDAYLMTLPMLDLKKDEYPIEYQIKNNNRIDTQKRYECAAFATAYVLRHFGIEADGFDLYANFPGKKKSGYIYPKGIRTYFKQQDFKTIYYKGNIKTLKKHISKGKPVIALIRVQKGSRNLHYVPIIGYDNEYLYIVESLQYLVNCNDENNNYNRKVPIAEFKQLWNIKNIFIPFYSNTYITVDKK